eukprot:365367-Chlamydomonas_euryale.AAC.5
MLMSRRASLGGHGITHHGAPCDCVKRRRSSEDQVKIKCRLIFNCLPCLFQLGLFLNTSGRRGGDRNGKAFITANPTKMRSAVATNDGAPCMRRCPFGSCAGCLDTPANHTCNSCNTNVVLRVSECVLRLDIAIPNPTCCRTKISGCPSEMYTDVGRRGTHKQATFGSTVKFSNAPGHAAAPLGV